MTLFFPLNATHDLDGGGKSINLLLENITGQISKNQMDYTHNPATITDNGNKTIVNFLNKNMQEKHSLQPEQLILKIEK